MDYRLVILFIAVTFPTLAHAQDSTKKRARLNEVNVTDKKQGNFGHMYQVDGMKITAGKKSEVINVEQLTVNKATNNTRQVYAKVAGLNIFENDGAGLQLSIGGRGLDPNRTSNFNVRQNGYDISADALGYPESYYTPPAEALSKIEILKGAAGLQYGTQFGGLLNFQMKKPGADKAFSLESRQTVGSFGFIGSFNSISGTKGKVKYYAYGHYKKGNGWRPNSQFESFNGYANIRYQASKKSTIGLELTHLQYLAQQPGGLTDKMFEEDPQQSNRTRNWFAVKWNLLDLEWNYRISPKTKLQTKAYALLASRKAIGFRDNRPSTKDPETTRDLLVGNFQNIAMESRLLHRYNIGKQIHVLLGGIRIYNGHSTNKQGFVNNGDGADFNFTNEPDELTSDYEYPNLNLAAFVEHIFRINSKWNITPGLRLEHIKTQALGSYRDRQIDLAGNILVDSMIDENRQLPRTFVLAGIGSNYKFSNNIESYANFSQNYRSVTFSDIRIINPSFRIDPDIEDEKGWSADLGLRGNINQLFRFDASMFYLYYGNRIGEYQAKEGNRTFRARGNIGVAQIYGLETFIELDVLRVIKPSPKVGVTVYSNLALTNATYTKSHISAVEGKDVEYVPFLNWKAGIQANYKDFKITYQFSWLTDQYTDATNASEGGYTGVNGIVPDYKLMDLSLSYKWRWLIIEGSVNNLANVAYFTRRATGYPGPGIIPGDGRSFYLTLGIKL